MTLELRAGEQVVQTVRVDNDCQFALTNIRIVKSLADNQVANSLELAELTRFKVGAPAIRIRGLVLSLLGFAVSVGLYLLLPQNWLGYALVVVPGVAGVFVLLDAVWLNRRKLLLRFYADNRKKPLAGVAALKDSEQVQHFMEDLKILAQKKERSNQLATTATHSYIGKDIHT